MRRSAWAVGAVVVAMVLAACSGGASAPDAAPSSAASGDLDCTLSLNAMGDYGTAVVDLATSVQANDSMSAVAAADAMLYAIGQLMPAIEGAGEPAQEFAAHAWAVAALVKSAAAKGTSMQATLPKITEAFGDPAFDVGGEALQDFVDSRCPSAAQD